MTDQTTTTETWTDIMPAIPLDGYEGPAIDHEGSRCTVIATGAGWVVVAYTRAPSPRGHVKVTRWDAGHVRPAIDESEGFGYALRWLTTECAARGVLLNSVLTDREHCLMELLVRWVAGKTTDADGLALARALRQVSP